MKEAKEKINKSKGKLKKDRDEKKISDKDYKERKEKIENAEKAVEDLEGNIKKGKELEKKKGKVKN